MDEGIDVEARGAVGIGQISARGCFVVDRAKIGTNVKGVFDAADGEGKSAAAVGEGDAEFREALENAAEYHRADRERSFCWHADQPWQPVLRHPLFADHVPWMDEDGGAQFFGGAPNR